MDAVKLLGSLLGNNATGGNLLGSLLGKATGGGAATGGAAGGGIGSMLGGLLGGGGGSTGGAGGMLGSLLGGGAAGGLLGSLMGGGSKEEAAAPTPAAPTPAAPQADQATLLIRAMCNAAKADGQVDQTEQQNIIGRLGNDVDQAEIDFLKSELSAPLDVAGFVSSVPADLAANVYAMSVMTIKVDTPQEAQYLQQLAQGLKLDNSTLGEIHKQLGVA